MILIKNKLVLLIALLGCFALTEAAGPWNWIRQRWGAVGLVIAAATTATIAYRAYATKKAPHVVDHKSTPQKPYDFYLQRENAIIARNASNRSTIITQIITAYQDALRIAEKVDFYTDSTYNDDDDNYLGWETLRIELLTNLRKLINHEELLPATIVDYLVPLIKLLNDMGVLFNSPAISTESGILQIKISNKRDLADLTKYISEKLAENSSLIASFPPHHIDMLMQAQQRYLFA